jgi:hypothetical protein
MMMFKLQKDKVTKEYRSKAKTLGFGLLFGMTASALAKRLNCSIEEAEDLFAQYFAAFPKLKRWTEKQIEFGYEHGYVITKFGRKIPIWELQDTRRWIREGGERACFNYPVQGGATGDYVRIGMVRARKVIRNRGWQDKVRLFMNVHDALEFYVHRSLDPVEVIHALQAAVIFDVPGWPKMVADWHIGKRWGSVKDLELDEDGTVRVKNGPTLGTRYLPTLQTEPKLEKIAAPPKEQILTYTSNEATKKIIIDIDHMPTRDQMVNLTKLTREVEGTSLVDIHTPQGKVISWTTTGITPKDHASAVSFILGGAKMYYKVPEQALDDLGSEIAF